MMHPSRGVSCQAGLAAAPVIYAELDNRSSSSLSVSPPRCSLSVLLLKFKLGFVCLMQRILDFKQARLHRLNLEHHGTDLFISLLDQLTDLLNRAIFLHDFDLLDLHLLLHRVKLPLHACLVTRLGHLEFFKLATQLFVLVHGFCQVNV